jgi:thiamine phosphate synthase YjbQ (UPF0047 family)
MADATAEITLTLRPTARFELINVSKLIREQCSELLEGYRKAVYYSYHTTAGYLDQKICSRLNYDSESVQAFVKSFQALFPPDANYQHDMLHLRRELNDVQRRDEPRNADAHLTFIGSGLTNCVTYSTRPAVPVYFIDLDGTNGSTRRFRQTTVMGIDKETLAGETQLSVPVSGHPVDSVNLKDERLGLFERLREQVEMHGITRGRISLTLEAEEEDAGLTVNEYETLLMKYDLPEVLDNPLRFMAEKGRHMLRDPRAVPSKAKEYAKYDLVQFVNEFVDAFGLGGSIIERLIDKFIAVPAARYLRMKRSVNLLVKDRGSSPPEIVEGMYQSPILVQWRKAATDRRHLKASFVRFE